MTVSDEKLLALGKEGFFVGPQEEEEVFLQRVNFSKKLRDHPSECSNKLPVDGEWIVLKEWKKLLRSCEKKMGCCPKWLLAYYSKEQLAPWQGAACWIFTHPSGFCFPKVQLKPSFKKGRAFLRSFSEVLEHEVVHALRCSFSEPCFEEVFASFLSEKKWRAFLGAIFRSPKEALFFAVLSLFLLVSELGLFFLGSLNMVFFACMSAAFFLITSFLYFMIRLLRSQRLLKRAFQMISKLVSPSVDPYLDALRLSDAEVFVFAKSSLDEVRSYVQSIRKTSLRWRQICLQFFDF